MLETLTIKKRLVIVILIFFIAISFIFIISIIGMQALSALRVHVAGEGFYSKGQKDAVFYLERYSQTHDENDYEMYLLSMIDPIETGNFYDAILRGDRFEAKQHYLKTSNHPDDFDEGADLIIQFQWVEQVQRNINVWKEGDVKVRELASLGSELHDSIISRDFSQPETDKILDRMYLLNDELQELGSQYSTTSGETARWLKNTLISIMVATTLVIIMFCSVLYYLILKGMIFNIGKLKKGAERVSEGNYNETIDIKSRDELGDLASTFNQMIDNIKKSHNMIKKSEINLKNAHQNLEDKISELKKVNKLAIGRELKMIELKKKMTSIEKTK